MPIILNNGINPKEYYFNNQPISKIIYNGNTVLYDAESTLNETINNLIRNNTSDEKAD